MESLKEIFDALSQRIKSPIFGYIILAFIAINWKPLYYLFFSGKPALMKFDFFEKNTDTWSLYLCPFGFGLIAALAAPHISNWGAWWAIKPINAMRKREVSAAHEVLQAKNKLTAERDNERAIYEQGLIDEAKRDVQIESLPDEQKVDLQKQIDELRASGYKPTNPQKGSMTLGGILDILPLSLEIVFAIGQSKSAKMSFQSTSEGRVYSIDDWKIDNNESKRDFARFRSAAEELETLDYIENMGGNGYFFELTGQGHDLYEKLQKQDFKPTIVGVKT
jgi:hypothetical protein